MSASGYIKHIESNDETKRLLAKKIPKNFTWISPEIGWAIFGITSKKTIVLNKQPLFRRRQRLSFSQAIQILTVTFEWLAKLGCSWVRSSKWVMIGCQWLSTFRHSFHTIWGFWVQPVCLLERKLHEQYEKRGKHEKHGKQLSFHNSAEGKWHL